MDPDDLDAINAEDAGALDRKGACHATAMPRGGNPVVLTGDMKELTERRLKEQWVDAVEASKTDAAVLRRCELMEAAVPETVVWNLRGISDDVRLWFAEKWGLPKTHAVLRPVGDPERVDEVELSPRVVDGVPVTGVSLNVVLLSGEVRTRNL